MYNKKNFAVSFEGAFVRAASAEHPRGRINELVILKQSRAALLAAQSAHPVCKCVCVRLLPVFAHKQSDKSNNNNNNLFSMHRLTPASL